MKINSFIEELKKIGIVLNENQLEQLHIYYEMLVSYNEKVNLTRIVNEEDFYLKHFYDSLTLNKIINLQEIKSLCDIGTGAGFPGLVIKIVYPHIKVTLVDSLNKRLLFINEVVKKLNLDNVELVHERGEDYIKRNQKFDLVTSRAVMRLDKLIDVCLPLVNQQGSFVAMKGLCEEELKESEKKIIKRQFQIKEVQRFLLPIEESHRTLIRIMKSK